MKYLGVLIVLIWLSGCATPMYVVPPSVNATSSIKVINDDALFYIYKKEDDCSHRYKVPYNGSYTKIEADKKIALTAFVEGKQGFGGYAFCPITFRFIPESDKSYGLIVGGKTDDACEAILVETVGNNILNTVDSVEFLIWNRGRDEKSSWCKSSKANKQINQD
ncbi:hypothetical protein [Pseudoalteromonas obscura]|uniref:Lipoprotein n=1 Tax=Pseudoalteromonas obscura TaxID=3048491 RepID=A0ABT7EFZ0_9GAMM|nr:hypothetical protein [Pseudoalteromonas sp. P94(2023)]MDK2593537.1 hypothetical protein [Pseudoalteromonas sp. P94(2023)]